MRFEAKQIILLLILINIIGIVVACGSTEVSVPEPSVEEVPLELSAFQVTNLTINPDEVYTGVEVVITAEVTNSGDTEDEYTAELRIHDVDGTSLPEFRGLKKVIMAPGETRLMSFLVSKKIPGTYKVTWGDVTGEFAVMKPALTQPNSPSMTTPKSVVAPDFSGVDVVTNDTISLTQFKGSAILLNFVNYGCSESLNQIVSAQLLAIRDLTKERDDFTPISIFCGCCPQAALREFALQNELKWPWILDTDYSIIAKYADYLRKYGYPTLIFIDKEQQIREVTGYNDVRSLSAKIDGISK